MQWITRPKYVNQKTHRGCAIYVHQCGHKMYVEF